MTLRTHQGEGPSAPACRCGIPDPARVRKRPVHAFRSALAWIGALPPPAAGLLLASC